MLINVAMALALVMVATLAPANRAIEPTLTPGPTKANKSHAVYDPFRSIATATASNY